MTGKIAPELASHTRTYADTQIVVLQ